MKALKYVIIIVAMVSGAIAVVMTSGGAQQEKEANSFITNTISKLGQQGWKSELLWPKTVAAFRAHNNQVKWDAYASKISSVLGTFKSVRECDGSVGEVYGTQGNILSGNYTCPLVFSRDENASVVITIVKIVGEDWKISRIHFASERLLGN